MKRTIFSKVFLNNIIIITVTFLVLTVLGGVFVNEAVEKERDMVVENNARSIESFMRNNIPSEQLKHFLHGVSQSTENNILIVDQEGKIMMASVNDRTYNHEAGYVPLEVCKAVFEGKKDKVQGTLGGVYKTKMVTYQFPFVNFRTNEVTAAIFVSVPVSIVRESQQGILRVVCMIVVLVVVLSFALSYALSRQISKPIREISASVKKFAKGDFSERVGFSKNYKIREVQELAGTFNGMAFHMEKAEELRNTFISDVSHELRTPMTTISGFVDGILDGTIPPEKQDEYLAIVKDEVLRLSGLVNSFLEVARSEKDNRTLEISDFDFNEVVRRTVLNLESRIIEKEIYVDIVFETDPCFVKADKNLIKSVLTNLLENAIKFTERQGKICISEKIRQHEVVVSVYNTGCGIAAEDKEFIFERFYKGDKSRSINKDGTGIGLYIVRDVLERHGKTISVNSVEGEYAEFVFALEKGKE